MSLKNLRTHIYVDGFNLYYGALKNTKYKWLDIYKLCERILSKHNQIEGIHYFTARVSPAPNDPDKPYRQQTYIRALREISPGFTVVYGQFSRHLVQVPLAAADLSKLPQGTIVSKNYHQSDINKQLVSSDHNIGPRVDIVKTEEKGSDVNLAIHLLNDAWLDRFDCAVVISNDSDLAGAISLAKQRKKIVGVLTPQSRPTKLLREKSDFVKVISERYLKKSQLPEEIGKIKKPKAWVKKNRWLSLK